MLGFSILSSDNGDYSNKNHTGDNDEEEEDDNNDDGDDKNENNNIISNYCFNVVVHM